MSDYAVFTFWGRYALGAIPPQTRMNTGFLPVFKNLPEQHMFNEWYAKDISRKVRSSKKLRGNAGDPMCLPPYGYKKDPDDPRKWIIDDEAAEVVRRIYRLCVGSVHIRASTIRAK